MANSVLAIMLFSIAWGSVISMPSSMMPGRGNSAESWPARFMRLAAQLILNWKDSFMEMLMLPSGMRRTISVNSLPGTTPRPGTSMSASTRVMIVMRSSEQVSCTNFCPASKRMPSRIGFVVLEERARVTTLSPSRSFAVSIENFMACASR